MPFVCKTSRLLGNTAKMSVLLNVMNISCLCVFALFRNLLCQPICVILVPNLRHIGVQFASYWCAVCRILRAHRASLAVLLNTNTDIVNYIAHVGVVSHGRFFVWNAENVGLGFVKIIQNNKSRFF